MLERSSPSEECTSVVRRESASFQKEIEVEGLGRACGRDLAARGRHLFPLGVDWHLRLCGDNHRIRVVTRESGRQTRRHGNYDGTSSELEGSHLAGVPVHHEAKRARMTAWTVAEESWS
jgi:hypothetical protein